MGASNLMGGFQKKSWDCGGGVPLMPLPPPHPTHTHKCTHYEKHCPLRGRGIPASMGELETLLKLIFLSSGGIMKDYFDHLNLFQSLKQHSLNREH